MSSGGSDLFETPSVLPFRFRLYGRPSVPTSAPPLIAAVDLGSNSFRLLIGRIESTPVGEQIRPLDQIKETVRLASGLGEGGRLSQAAQDRALAALQRFGERLRAFAPDTVRAVATNTFRVATDARAFLERSQDALGFPIEVIAGREEARLIYLGAAHTLPADGRTRLVVDIGGGSTECIVGTDYESALLESIPLGCVSLTQRHFSDGRVDRAGMDHARLACRETLEPLSQRFRDAGWTVAIGTSGTAKSLWQIAQADFGETALTREALSRMEAALIKVGHVDRMSLTGLKTDRRPVLPGGLVMMSAVFEEFGIESLEYCDGALREGVLYDLLGRSAGADMRSITVARVCRRYGIDDAHGQALAALSSELYRQACRSEPDDVSRDARLLSWASQLCEIGMSISHIDHHKHGSYILSHCDMPGFSEHEQAVIADIVLGQTGGLTKMRARMIDEDDWLRVLCMRLAVILLRRRDGQHPPQIRLKLKSSGARVELPREWIDSHPLTHQSLEQESAEWSRAGPWPLLYQPALTSRS
jgi:exopolyphosphatase/guanosine-5'-triphosphate,3'-diphosphate pyrophosphatase